VTTTPLAPWVLSGESIVCLARWPGARDRGRLPAGLRRLPGPALVVAVRYTGSPVGPYLELAVGEPARLGARPGWSITTMIVDSPDSRLGGVLNWGFPKQLGTLRWSVEGRRRELRWEERGITVAGEASRFVLPALVPVRALQRRSDGPVVVPGRLRGMARPATVTVTAPEDDPLTGLSGAHLGVVVSGMRFIVKPARRPAGITTSLRAPLRAPEPAPGGAIVAVSSGAYSSAG
jgi:hypothetical protein